MDFIFSKFLEKQAADGAALARASDILQLQPLHLGEGPPRKYIARFCCRGLVRLADMQVTAHNQFAVGIYFPEHYLRQASTFETLTFLEPKNVFHPNIRVPHICVGERFLRPGTPLVEILYQLHALIIWRKWASHAGLNPDACQWAINNQHLFPADSRPLKRRKLDLDIELSRSGGQGS